MRIAVFPGQGSQSPGFLAPWLDVDGTRDRLAQYSEWSGVDLVAAGTEWDADRIRDTQVAQPLIVAASHWILVRSIAAGLGDAGPRTATATTASGDRPVIAMMPKAKGDPYFISARAGAEEAAREVGV